MSSIIKGEQVDLVPREVITARLQVGHDAKLIAQGGSPLWITVKQILKEKGPMGFFRGFWSTTIRDWPFMVILFTTYESFKQNHHVLTLRRAIPTKDAQNKSWQGSQDAQNKSWQDAEDAQNKSWQDAQDAQNKSWQHHSEDNLSTLKSTLFGGISGALAGFLTTPFDVIKTRIMTQKGTAKLSIQHVATSLWSGKIGGKTGPAALFVGGSARSIWW